MFGVQLALVVLLYALLYAVVVGWRKLRGLQILELW